MRLESHAVYRNSRTCCEPTENVESPPVYLSKIPLDNPISEEDCLIFKTVGHDIRWPAESWIDSRVDWKSMK